MKINIEEILKQALPNLRNKIMGPCLTENEIASLVEGKLSHNKRDTIFAHLVSCEKCALELKENLEDLEQIEKEDLMEVPSHLLQSAMDLVKQKEAVQRIPAYLSMPLKISDLSVRCHAMARAGKTARPRPKIIKKISFTPNAAGFVYLFQVGRKKVDVILQKEKIQKGMKTELISKIEKPLAKKKGLVLVFAKTPLKNISAIKNALLKTMNRSAEEKLESLNQKLTKQKGVVRFL